MTTKRVAPVIEKLRSWREKNGLSQRGAVEVMVRGGCEIKVTTLQKWESGVNSPGQFTVKYLEDFFVKHPVVKDGPRYERWKDKTSDVAIEEIRKARAKGETLRSIADRYDLSEASISRIAKGDRRGGAGEQTAATGGTPQHKGRKSK